MRVPLEELLPEYNVHLISSGRKWKALCPFHQEKTPSFHLDPEKQLYHCYGCSEGGDVYSFVQAMEKVSFQDAVEILARRAGVVIEEADPAEAERRQSRQRLYDANDFAANFYHQVLLEDPRAETARQYLDARHIDRSMWSRFRLGFSPHEWEELSRRGATQGIGGDILERAGLVRRRERGGGVFDYFRGRLMFPIDDDQGRVIGFGARTLGDDVPKYLNTAKTETFDKSQVLYGMSLARVSMRQAEELVVVEGYTDVIAAHQAGLENFVASLGTAFTQENAIKLARITKRVCMVFDGDAAGQDALDRSLDVLIAKNIDVRIHTVPDGKDPCDAVLFLGGEEFRRQIHEESLDIFDFKWRLAVESAQGEAERAAGIDECLKLLLKLPNQVRVQMVLQRFAERSRVEAKSLHARLAELSKRAPRARTSPAQPREVASSVAAFGDLAETVMMCLFALEAQAQEIWSEVPPEIFSGEAGQHLVAAVDGEIRAGSLSAEKLAKSIGDAQIMRWLIQLIHRLDKEMDAERGARPDYQVLWGHCQNDIKRWQARANITELEQGIRAASGDAGKVLALRRELMQLRKTQKCGPRRV